MMNLLERMMAGKDLHQPLVYHISIFKCGKYNNLYRCHYFLSQLHKHTQKNKFKFSQQELQV